MPVNTKPGVLAKLKRGTSYVDGHWLYIKGGIIQGYHYMALNTKKVNVCRLSLWIYKDFDLTSGLQANHTIECKYKNCWNPDHLYIGTHAQNMSDQPIKGEHRETKRTTCFYGHPLDGITRPHGTNKTHRYCKTCSRNKMRDKRKRMRRVNV